ncbi:interleukin-4 [Microtus pennsylvanicus]|uniref:Interleukin-4 n=1 Tax=Microtus ochrogaster TaxID=79684 RepID=A0ABM0KPL4_MICOH|nr:interleukin-4 [Microtus ochrogaster]
MGLSPQGVAILLCLLACTGNSTHGCNGRALKESIHILNQVTEKGTPCTDRMNVSDILTARNNTTERELMCKTFKVLHKFYIPHETLCLANNPRLLKDLKRLIRNIHGLSPSPRNCTVNESTHTTLTDFLGSLKRIMQRNYWLCGSSKS